MTKMILDSKRWPARFALAIAFTAGLILCAPAFGAEEKKPAPESKKAKVYTNKDLEKYKGLAPRHTGKVVDTSSLAPPADTQSTGAITPAERQRRLADLDHKIAAAEARIAAIDQRIKSVRNPYLPRPEVSADEKQAEAGMGAAEIVEKLQSERDDLAKQVEALKAEREKVQAAPAPSENPDAGAHAAADAGQAAEPPDSPPEPSPQQP